LDASVRGPLGFLRLEIAVRATRPGDQPMKPLAMFAGSLVFSLTWPTLACHAEAAPTSTARPGADGLMTIEQVVQDSHEGVEYIDNEELQKRIRANPKLVLIDVRTKEEYDAGHLKGATWIERGVAEFTLARTLRDPDAEIVVYCKKGNRSGLVAKALKRIGYRHVKSHVGFDFWAEAGLPFYNFLGKARLLELRPINSATNPVDYSAEKN
jgi:rhodanese-related sulfurtransferase